ncbi:hypothetical protein [Nonomuraea sp. CA-141351]|uniref:hypothetical protein n=1 Tax=Nonomuraea sp. CA-141351 TaxID=3239996 RepID=UPI003D8E0FF8
MIAVAAVIGWTVHKLAPHVLTKGNEHGGDGGPAPLIPDDAQPSWRSAGKILAVGLLATSRPIPQVPSRMSSHVPLHRIP